MLDAACAGEVFTSPVPDQMLEATKGVDGGAGVLHIVKNYTGDVMNFEMAAELAAAETGVEVAPVVTDDDVAVQDSLYTAGRRGVGVTVLVEKIAGAAAEERPRPRRGRRRRPAASTRAAAAWASRSPPARCPPSGKPDVRPARGRDRGRRRHPRRARPAPRAARARARDRRAARRRRSWTTSTSPAATACIAFVNGMGGTPLIELYLMYGEVARLLEKAGVTVRAVARRARTSPASTWPAARSRCSRLDDELLPAVGRAGPDAGPALGSLTMTDGRDRRRRRADAGGSGGSRELVAEHRDELTDLDSAIGDADHGTNMDRGMTAVVGALADERRRPAPAPCSSRSGMTLVSTVGGASGPLYGTFFLRMAAAARRRSRPRRRRASRRRCAPDSRASSRAARPRPATRRCSTRWRPALDALDARARRRRAPGRRALAAASAAADAGRDATIPMLARKGRASYLGERSVGHQDPGATSAALLVGGRRAGAHRRRHDVATVVGIVVVSHSRALARGRGRARRRDAARRRRAHRGSPPGSTTAPSAPTPSAIVTPSPRPTTGDGVVVLMDLGSAVLSAELALDLLDDERASRVMLCPAPLVEGLVVAAVAAAGGADRDEVAAEAAGRSRASSRT